jgi:hypothetical protein
MVGAISDEMAGLRRVVENQIAALAHWRRDADLDAAQLKRQNEALFRIAHGHDALNAVRTIAAVALCAQTMKKEQNIRPADKRE